jgi:hypothetical protein
LHRIASIIERLSIEINVTEEHLKSRIFEINPGQWTLYEKKNGTAPGKTGRMEPLAYIPIGHKVTR